MALRAQMEEARERAEASAEELSRLEDLRNEVDGRRVIALREAAAFEDRLAQEEAELEQLRVQGVLTAFERAVSARNDADEALAAKILEVIDGLTERENLTGIVTELHQKLSAHAIRIDIPEQRPSLIDAWQRLQEIVRASLGEELEDDLIEAAVASPLGKAIEDLPIHLREAARLRRIERVRAAPKRTSRS